MAEFNQQQGNSQDFLLRIIAHSPMVQKPRQTIAWGILTALLYYTLICLTPIALFAVLVLGSRASS